MMHNAHEGYLWLERTTFSRGWRKCWFVLDEGHLRYFDHADDLEPLATIDVHGM